MTGDAIVGWRSWWCRDGRLHSVFQPSRWEPGVPLEASALPGLSDSLGIHAWSSSVHLGRLVCFGSGGVPVWGEVSLWGRVVEHSEGWRAQYAYPLSLLVLRRDADLAPRLASAYGVEASIL